MYTFLPVAARFANVLLFLVDSNAGRSAIRAKQQNISARSTTYIGNHRRASETDQRTQWSPAQWSNRDAGWLHQRSEII